LETSIIVKRKFPRFNTNIPITIYSEGYSEQTAVCKNISEGGAYIEISNNSVEEKIPIFYNELSKARVKIPLTNRQNQFETLSAIRWLKSIAKNDKYGFGIEFLGLSSVKKNKLSSYIEKNLRSVPKKFIYKTKAYLKDINVFGTTYFARYFDWQGEAREDFFQIVPGHEKLMTSGIVLTTKNASIEYKQSVRLFDEVIIEVTTDNVKKLSFELIFRYYIKRLINDAQTKGLAAIAKEKICFVKPSEITGVPKAVPIPEPIRQTALLTLDQSKK